MTSGYIPTKDEPGFGEILRALRKVRSNNSALGGTPVEEFARQLVVGGYLREEPSLSLVAGMLEILEVGGFGLRSPTLQPCSIEFYWDDDADQVSENIDLSLSINWVGAPAVPKIGSVPEKLTHAKTPSCTDLISEPKEVLRNKERWPLHICGEEFMRQSTELWALAQPFAVDSMNIYRWASMHPLPIGRTALAMRPEVADPSEWAQILDVLPFDGSEKAAWALHVKDKDRETWGALDLFGLEERQAHGFSVAGALAHQSSGTNTALLDVLGAAERWWAQFRGRALRGRPKGSGTWPNRAEFECALDRALANIRSDGGKVTQENVAERLHTSDRQLREYLRLHGINWQEFRKT